MAPRGPDPYQTLGVDAGISDDELRAAYRRLVQLHHPDHNGGSAESARRFEEVQDAYARIRELRRAGTGAPRSGTGAPRSGTGAPRSGTGAPGAGTSTRRSGQRPSSEPPRQAADPKVESRMADLERELREAHLAREREVREAHLAQDRARQAAREAAAAAGERPSDEELGYVTTDDSFSKIIADARAEISDRFSEAKEHPVAKRVGDLIDELDELVSNFARQHPPRSRP